MNENLISLLQTHMPKVRYVFWDLDGTLGEFPGWDGIMPVRQYLNNYIQLQNLLATLKQHGIKNWLVSRNGMFCAPYHAQVEQTFGDIGFDKITSCYREHPGSKITGYGANFSKVQRRQVLLVDDQERECLDALQDGAYALHVPAGFWNAMQTGNFALFIPAP
jgi:hypothetical protein